MARSLGASTAVPWNRAQVREQLSLQQRFLAMRPGVQGRGYAQRTGSASLHSSPAPEQLCFVRKRVPCKTSFAEEHSAAKQTCLKTAGVEGVTWDHVQFGSEKGKAQKHTFSARYHELVLSHLILTTAFVASLASIYR